MTDDEYVSEDRTKNLPTNYSFEERVMARLDAIDGRLSTIETRLEKLEAKNYEAKPIWERALKEVAEIRQEMNARFEEIGTRLNDLDGRIVVLGGDVLRLRARPYVGYERAPYGTAPYEDMRPKPGPSEEGEPADKKKPA